MIRFVCILNTFSFCKEDAIKSNRFGTFDGGFGASDGVEVEERKFVIVFVGWILFVIFCLMGVEF